MRYLTAAFSYEGGAIHPWGRTIAAEPSVTRGPLSEMELIDGGVAKMLCRFYGDARRGYELTRDHDLVIEADLADAGRGLTYLRVEMPSPSREMLLFQRETRLMLVMPLRFRPDGAPIATFLGEEGELADGLSAVPDAVDIELRETGDYDPESNDVFAALTSHQQQLLRAAVEAGYYECPREATQADIADAVGCSAGTVGEHLRKIESRVFNRIVE